MPIRPLIGFTNGCFDILHAGHVEFLRDCSNRCDNLIVALNSDESVKALKGPGRPVNTYRHRALVLQELRCVWKVVVLADLRINSLLERVKPDVWFKGGDYTIDTLDKGEVEVARSIACSIQIIPVTINTSTTKILGYAKES